MYIWFNIFILYVLNNDIFCDWLNNIITGNSNNLLFPEHTVANIGADYLDRVALIPHLSK